MNINTIFQLTIPKRMPACVSNGELFTPGMEYYSILIESNSEGGFERRDYCVACWEKETPASQECSWRSVVPQKKALSEGPKQRDARALFLLREALAQEAVVSKEEAFILGLYLQRRRRLLPRQEVTLPDGGLAVVYEVAETEEMLCVPKLPLSQLQIATVQTSLAAKFCGCV